MVRIKDIAKATGYSITTVSKAFNGYSDISEKARKSILEAVDTLGYVPNANARSLATKKSYTIGIIFDEILGYGLSHPFFGPLIENFRKAVEKEGYDILFISNSIGNTNIKTYLDHCVQRDVDGIFLACSGFESEDILELMNSGIPGVSVEIYDEKKINCVKSDNFSGSYLAVEYLYNLGHRDIAHIAGVVWTYAGNERRLGYLAALKDYDLEKKPHYILDGEYFTWQGGYNAMSELLTYEDRPTGVVVAGDMMALGALKAVMDHGLRVPDDISIIGFDNIDMVNYTIPRLTTVAQDVKAMGENAAAILVQNIKEPKGPKRDVIIATKIIERDSCRRID